MTTNECILLKERKSFSEFSSDISTDQRIQAYFIFLITLYGSVINNFYGYSISYMVESINCF